MSDYRFRYQCCYLGTKAKDVLTMRPGERVIDNAKSEEDAKTKAEDFLAVLNTSSPNVCYSFISLDPV